MNYQKDIQENINKIVRAIEEEYELNEIDQFHKSIFIDYTDILKGVFSSGDENNLDWYEKVRNLWQACYEELKGQLSNDAIRKAWSRKRKEAGIKKPISANPEAENKRRQRENKKKEDQAFNTLVFNKTIVEAKKIAETLKTEAGNYAKYEYADILAKLNVAKLLTRFISEAEKTPETDRSSPKTLLICLTL